jgi:hypothetical protein
MEDDGGDAKRLKGLAEIVVGLKGIDDEALHVARHEPRYRVAFPNGEIVLRVGNAMLRAAFAEVGIGMKTPKPASHAHS